MWRHEFTSGQRRGELCSVQWCDVRSGKPTTQQSHLEAIFAGVGKIAADRPIQVSFLDRADALEDADLIRTKVNLIPDSVTTIRVVDIVGLDKQADGGTHVSSTGEVGTFSITKTVLMSPAMPAEISRCPMLVFTEPTWHTFSVSRPSI